MNYTNWNDAYLEMNLSKRNNVLSHLGLHSLYLKSEIDQAHIIAPFPLSKY